MAKRPHVIVLMTDQHRYDTLGAYGDHQCDTPHLDSLAAESVTFERHYTSCPLCVPARTSLATGKYASRVGVIVNYWIPEEARYGTLVPEHKTLYERFSQEGYDVAQIGVQHVHCDPPLPQRVPDGLFLDNRHYKEHMDLKGLPLPNDADYRAYCPDFIEGNMVAAQYTTPRTGVWPHAPENTYDHWIADETVKYI